MHNSKRNYRQNQKCGLKNKLQALLNRNNAASEQEHLPLPSTAPVQANSETHCACNKQTDDSDALLGLAALRVKFQEICSDPNAQAALLADQISQFLAQRRGQRPPEDDQSFLLVRRI